MENSKNEIVALANIDDLIVIKQLPVITEQLKSIKAYIETKVEGVLALGCTEGTVKAIKVLRSDLNKDFKALEDRRKFIKNKVLAPYEEFEGVYKECVTNIFKDADSELKKRINNVEDNLKFEKRKEIEDYFNEYSKSKGIDFVGFTDTGINVTLSASKKSLKEAAKAFLDRICDDLALIDTQEHKAEILVEYKQSLNVSASITTVMARHKAIAEERSRAEQAAEAKRTRDEMLKNVAQAAVKAQNDEPLTAPKIDNKRYRVTFTVVGPRTELSDIKQYILSKDNCKIIK